MRTHETRLRADISKITPWCSPTVRPLHPARRPTLRRPVRHHAVVVPPLQPLQPASGVTRWTCSGPASCSIAGHALACSFNQQQVCNRQVALWQIASSAAAAETLGGHGHAKQQRKGSSALSHPGTCTKRTAEPRTCSSSSCCISFCWVQTANRPQPCQHPALIHLML